MNKQKELSISQIQELMDWSYPTALKYAQKYGRQDESSKWLVLFDTIKPLVQEQTNIALRRQARMFALEDARNAV